MKRMLHTSMVFTHHSEMGLNFRWAPLSLIVRHCLHTKMQVKDFVNRQYLWIALNCVFFFFSNSDLSQFPFCVTIILLGTTNVVPTVSSYRKSFDIWQLKQTHRPCYCLKTFNHIFAKILKYSFKLVKRIWAIQHSINRKIYTFEFQFIRVKVNKNLQNVLHVTPSTQWLASRPGHTFRRGSYCRK